LEISKTFIVASSWSSIFTLPIYLIYLGKLKGFPLTWHFDTVKQKDGHNHQSECM
jgi:hypothetical protein